jgi:hypothetical protein
MPKARLKPNFRGDWTPLVSATSQAIEVLEGNPHRTFEIGFFDENAGHQLSVRGGWDRVRGIVFDIPETPFIKTTLTKWQESTLLLTGWRRNPAKEKISYVYALHGKLRTDFLAGAVIDAVREILGERPDTWFELQIDGQLITKVNSELFEANEKIDGRFRVRL